MWKIIYLEKSTLSRSFEAFGSVYRITVLYNKVLGEMSKTSIWEIFEQRPLDIIKRVGMLIPPCVYILFK